MSDKQLSALTAATSLDSADLLLVSQGGNSRKATVGLVRQLAAFSGAKAKKSADQNTANYTTQTVVAFDGTDEWDTDAYHDPSVNNTRLTAPADGWYEIIGQVGVSNIGSNQITVWIRPNGSDPSLFSMQRSLAAVSRAVVQVRSTIQLTASQYVELVLQIDTDTSVTVLADRTYFEIRRLA